MNFRNLSWLLPLLPIACAPPAYNPGTSSLNAERPGSSGHSSNVCPVTPSIPYASPVGPDGRIVAFVMTNVERNYVDICQGSLSFSLARGAVAEIARTPPGSRIVFNFGGNMSDRCPYLPNVKFSDIDFFGGTSLTLPPDILDMIMKAGCVITKRDPDLSSIGEFPRLSLTSVPYTTNPTFAPGG